MKSIGFLIFGIFLLVLTGNAFAYPQNEYSFFVDNDKYYLMEKNIVSVRKMPELPAEISKEEALEIWNSGKNKLTKKEVCSSQYTSFTNGIGVRTDCTRKTILWQPTESGERPSGMLAFHRLQSPLATGLTRLAGERSPCRSNRDPSVQGKQ